MGRASRTARDGWAQRGWVKPIPSTGRYRPKPDKKGYTPETEKARYERTRTTPRSN